MVCFRTITLALILVLARTGALVGNVLFPVLLDAGCLPPFVLEGSLFAGKSSFVCKSLLKFCCFSCYGFVAITSKNGSEGFGIVNDEEIVEEFVLLIIRVVSKEMISDSQETAKMSCMKTTKN